jgi:hypothetical protein
MGVATLKGWTGEGTSFKFIKMSLISFKEASAMNRLTRGTVASQTRFAETKSIARVSGDITKNWQQRAAFVVNL